MTLTKGELISIQTKLYWVNPVDGWGKSFDEFCVLLEQYNRDDAIEADAVSLNDANMIKIKVLCRQRVMNLILSEHCIKNIEEC